MKNLFVITFLFCCNILKTSAFCCAGHNACGNHNGGCSHLCLAHSAGHVDNRTHHCACPTHYRLNTDHLTCLGQYRPVEITPPPPNSFQFFVFGYTAKKIKKGRQVGRILLLLLLPVPFVSSAQPHPFVFFFFFARG